MSVVQCPHCARHVTNDGSLAGRVVICPGCHRQFQMPPAEEDTPAIKHGIRELKKRRKRMSLRIWFGGRFSWSRDVATEPFVFYLITFTVALFSVGCGLIVIRLFGWRAATGIRFSATLLGSLMALFPVAIYTWYRIEATPKEAAVNASLDNQLRLLKQILAERARQAAEAKRIQNEQVAAVRHQATRKRQARIAEREKKFGAYSIRYLPIWLILSIAPAILVGCLVDFIQMIVIGTICSFISFFIWFSGRTELKKELDWRDRHEACRSCKTPGGGKLFEEDAKNIEGTHCSNLFYECRFCGHKWVKVTEWDKIPLHYHRYVQEFRRQHLDREFERASREVERAYEKELNRPVDIEWRDRQEACPSCKTPGGGKLFKEDAKLFKEDALGGQSNYSNFFYKCSFCGHEWVKATEWDKIPHYYLEYLQEFRKKRLKQLNREMERLKKEVLDRPDDSDS